MSPPLLLAHRGGAHEALENSLAAIAHASEAGADGIELDVRLASDGTPVLFHDDDLRRLAGSDRRVEESGLHELVVHELVRKGRRPRGDRIPTLAQALEAAGPLRPVQLELKSSGEVERFVVAVLDELERKGLRESVEITSFDSALVREARRRAPWLVCGLVLDAPPPAEWLDYPIASLSKRLARAGWAERAASAGVRPYVWTENDPSALDRWERLGVPGLITDRPALLSRARRERR